MASQPPMNMKNKCVYVFFSAPITPQSVDTLIEAVSHTVATGCREIYLVFSTVGGSVADGIRLHNYLRGLPCRLTVHGIGNVDSIGITVFVAADKRYAAPHVRFLFHGVGMEHPKGRFTEKMLLEMLGTIQKDQARISDVITDRTKITPSEMEDFFRKAATQDTTFALSKNVIEEIRPFKQDASYPVITIKVSGVGGSDES
ncbi:MAG: ATP-dependent Clp protease proteolytic subunit [Acidobacteria bacterium]|nr:ATP-dependent Clp protease proteolytic subunit [Acidobacteriota bacterium]